MHHHDSTYTTIGNIKNVEPDLLQDVLSFIEMNTQIPQKIDVPEDMKQDLGMCPTDIPGTDVKDEIGTLRALNKVSFGIREQCKLIADLTYQMDDVVCGETVLGHLTELYKKYVCCMQKRWTCCSFTERSPQIHCSGWPKEEEERIIPWEKDSTFISNKDSQGTASETFSFRKEKQFPSYRDHDERDAWCQRQ